MRDANASQIKSEAFKLARFSMGAASAFAPIASDPYVRCNTGETLSSNWTLAPKLLLPLPGHKQVMPPGHKPAAGYLSGA